MATVRRCDGAKVRRWKVRRWKVLLLLLLSSTASGCTTSSASSQDQAPATGEVSFLSIIVDKETAAADTRLKRFLERAIANGSQDANPQQVVRLRHKTMPYSDVIREFAERKTSGGYLARITPYAYVAAEMLGAKLDILATYKSVATRRTTYQSYFVIRKDQLAAHSDWKADRRAATLEDIKTFLERHDKVPARFIYHDRFSTSSYFLPSLYFKAHDIFAMRDSINPNLISIDVQRVRSTSSTELVYRVWRKQAELAAVWDGTKQKFHESVEDAERRGIGNDVLFIPIPIAVPNDFLVASGVDDDIKKHIVAAIKMDPGAGRLCSILEDGPVLRADAARQPRPPCSTLGKDDQPTDDFDAWYVWDSNDSEVSDTAREALARLRQDARQRPTPVVVKVEGRSVSQPYVEAAKEAVRLSGTEFVLEDRDLHKRVDMTWTLASAHDGALTLTSTLDSSFGESAEQFSISFVDRNDLPQRIADLVRSRFRRIRYIWPYEQKYPAVLRDLDFTPDDRVLVQKISWLDPKRNEYEEDTPFLASVENNTDFSKLQLSDENKFPKNDDGSFNFDPLSNVAYRVVIARQPQAGLIWTVLPYCFIGLFALACIGLVVDLRRRRPLPRGLHQTYDRMVEAYHRPWRGREIDEGAIVWCDPKYLDDFVKELKTAGSFLDLVQAGGLDFNLGPLPLRFSVLMKLGSRLISRRPQLSSGLFGTGDAGNVAALDALIGFLVRRRRLSVFIGLPESSEHGPQRPAWPIEWEALNDIASRHFRDLGICDKRVDANFGTGLSAAGHSALSAVVSNHFRGVVKRATREASLFLQTWDVREPGAADRLVYEGELRSALLLRDDNGAVQAGKVRLEVHLPPEAVLSRSSAESTLRAWVFGKILNWSVEHGTLSVRVRPIAVLKDNVDQQ
jgi:ABC-type phosphate/phosphonate transport system substrate-binding protein